MQYFWYASDKRRERFVSICRDPDVQRLTWEAYMNKELSRRDPLAHVRIFFKDLAHLFRWLAMIAVIARLGSRWRSAAVVVVAVVGRPDDRRRPLVRKPALSAPASAELAVRAGLDGDLRADRHRGRCSPGTTRPTPARGANWRRCSRSTACSTLAWSPLFFKLRRPDWALLELILFWLSIVALIVSIAPFSARAAWLLAPYLAWVTFAGWLNWRVVQLNEPFGQAAEQRR